MLATYKLAENTPVSFDVAARALSDALSTVLRATPSVEVLALALAKTTLESGRKDDLYWVHSKHWNIGNIKAGPSYEGMFTTYACNEILAEQGERRVVWFSPFGRLSGRGGVVVSDPYTNPPGHPQTRFRAYAGPTDGAYQYVDFVATGRYVDAFGELLEGDAPGYVNALHRKGYFTADPTIYGRGVLSLHKEFIARLQGRPAPAMWIPSVDVIQDLVAPQKWNAEEVLALEGALDIAREANRASAHAQMAISEPDDPDDGFSAEEPPTKDETPHGNA